MAEAIDYARAALRGDLEETHRCRNHELKSNGNGSSTNRRCRLPKFSCLASGNELRFDYCALHIDDDLASVSQEMKTEVLSKVFSERGLIENSFAENDVNRWGDPYGSPSHPIKDIDVEILEIFDQERQHIVYESSSVGGPIVIKNCRIGQIEFDLSKGKILTIVDSEIRVIKWKSGDPGELRFWAKNCDIRHLSLEHVTIGKIGANGSTLHKFRSGPNQAIKGPIVLTKSECHFEGGDFSQASVAVAKKLSFSQSKVMGCRMTPWTSDEWQMLLRTYGGNNSLFAILLFMAFAVPLLTDYALWATVQKAQLLLRSLPLSPGTTTELTKCLAPECESMNLVLLIFGYQNGLPYLLLTISLLILNVLRLLMTREVAMIRESAELSGRYPERGRILPPFEIRNETGGSKLAAWRYSYRHLIYVHYVISALLVVSFISFGFSVISVVGQTVWVPKSYAQKLVMA